MLNAVKPNTARHFTCQRFRSNTRPLGFASPAQPAQPSNRMPQFALGGSRATMLREGAVTNNNRNSSTNIGNMNVTVPPGADPAGYANGIRQELQRYDNVMNANQGLL